MKVPLEFDPNEHDYGPGSATVRLLLTMWADIDWFEPTVTRDRDAISIFREYHDRARAAEPELFPPHLTLNVVYGRRPEFEAWCKRVREQTSWDWKLGALKQLSHKHSQARGWSFETWARSRPETSRPGDLARRFQHGAVWTGVLPSAALSSEGDQFYVNYAHGDLLDAITWQLAEGRDQRSNNPFYPLVRCYVAGIYPFSLGESTVVLFRWRD